MDYFRFLTTLAGSLKVHQHVLIVAIFHGTHSSNQHNHKMNSLTERPTLTPRTRNASLHCSDVISFRVAYVLVPETFACNKKINIKVLVDWRKNIKPGRPDGRGSFSLLQCSHKIKICSLLAVVKPNKTAPNHQNEGGYLVVHSAGHHCSSRCCAEARHSNNICQHEWTAGMFGR